MLPLILILATDAPTPESPEQATESATAEPQRHGAVIGLSMTPGFVPASAGFIPSTDGRLELGGHLRPWLTLSGVAGVRGYYGLGRSVSAGVGDIAVTVTPRFGLQARAGVGVVSKVPVRGRPLLPGVGGFVGLGWEFRVGKYGGLGLGIEHDLRVRPDGRSVSTWGVVFAARLRGLGTKTPE